ncbi:hypothetical protein ACS0TY_010983 [Phlomoides rotata]
MVNFSASKLTWSSRCNGTSLFWQRDQGHFSAYRTVSTSQFLMDSKEWEPCCPQVSFFYFCFWF